MRPKREEFILDVRRSARALQQPNVAADAPAIDTDAISRILHRAHHWLTPKVVEHYRPADFTIWPAAEQGRLQSAVREFRKAAEQVAPDKPATVAQFMEGAGRFRELSAVLGSMVLGEWLQAIETVESQAEEWSAELAWRTRRVTKKLTESLIGTYEAPQLLVYAEPNLYVLDPLARFVPGAQGAFDFGIQPSYCTTFLYRDDHGSWHVQLDVRNGVSKGNPAEWSKDSFQACIEQLRVLV